MKRILAILAELAVLCAVICACAGCAKPEGEKQTEGDTQTESAAPDSGVRTLEAPQIAGKVETAGNISVFVPEGWVLVPGGPGGKQNDDSVFIKAGEGAGDPYIWVSIQSLGNALSSVENNSTEEIEPFMLNGAKWQGRSGAFYSEIDGTLYIIMLHPSLSYDNENVLAAAASLAG